MFPNISYSMWRMDLQSANDYSIEVLTESSGTTQLSSITSFELEVYRLTSSEFSNLGVLQSDIEIK
jgi:hypothetical protein